MNRTWKEFLLEDQFDLKSLIPKETLHPGLWKNLELNPNVTKKLMEIAQDIIESMNLTAKIKDVVITGSMASYNWHDSSDIDLHIILDFTEIDENYDLVKKFLDQSRINWNKVHNIFIDGHEVELYFQDINERNETAGLYSIFQGSWSLQPKKIQDNIDLRTAEKKANAISNNVEHLFDLFEQKKYDECYKFASKVKDRIKRMRQFGLSNGGIYSPENLAFKMLRNSEVLKKLSSLKISAYDKMMSINLEEDKNGLIL